MFDIDNFVNDLAAARTESRPQLAIKEVLLRAVADPAAAADTLRPTEGGISVLHHSDVLTVLNVVWAPYMTIYPHNHRMWAVIGVYTGREDNIFWKRSGKKVEAAAAQALSERDTVPLGPDIIHSVTNPIPRLTGAIHVYGGDFFAIERSEWDPETLREGRYDSQKAMRHFEDSNARS